MIPKVEPAVPDTAHLKPDEAIAIALKTVPGAPVT